MNTDRNRTQAEFAQLIGDVRACKTCDRMSQSARVLNYSSGNLQADLMFVAEAPGRLGADATEVPLHGDAAGKNFEDLLKFSGLRRDEIFVTNAVLCNPKDEHGNNAPPSKAEVANCARFLRRQIELVDPKIVVALGNAALRALALLENHDISLSEGPVICSWFGRHLIGLYHPGQRAMLRRSFTNQRSDYQFVVEQLRRLGKPQRKSSGSTKSDVLALARHILSIKAELSYFELHKLAYLAEYVHVRRFGRRLTSAYFIRQKDGPYCTDLELKRLRRASDSIKVATRGGKLFLRIDPKVSDSFFAEETISDAAREAVEEALSRYGDKDEADLKTAVYLTAPMKFLLRKERATQTNLHNAPIDFLAAA
jgi:uracil-DNA glycosylase family 4